MKVKELSAFCSEVHDEADVEVELEGEWCELDTSRIRAVLTADQLEYVEDTDEEGS